MRCEGWRRYGGMMTLGPVTWRQCEEEGIVSIKVKQDGEIATFPACKICWKEAITDKDIEIIEVVPLDVESEKEQSGKKDAENKRLREALTEIECRAYGTIYDIAVQALRPESGGI
jgi:hypothetical protein